MLILRDFFLIRETNLTNSHFKNNIYKEKRYYIYRKDNSDIQNLLFFQKNKSNLSNLD